jgi:hypothetical protein
MTVTVLYPEDRQIPDLRYAKTVTNMPSCECKLPRSERARPDAFLTVAIA